ncbi:MAG TPA: hypothetical protein VLB27_06955, partial [candidate division Zixibacteria bacterium]|nr:hypothetical protein [candidate division Zixibacteria bacterium]
MANERITGFFAVTARAVGAILCALFLAGGAWAQRPDLELGKPQIFPNFGLDWAQFQADDTNLTLVEVYYRIPNSGVTFKSVDSGYEASYELYLDLMDGDFQVGRREFRRTIFVQEYERTKLYTDYVVNMADFVTDAGDYEIVGTMIDSHSGQQSRRRIKAKVSDFSQSKFPKISGIEFLYSYRPQAGSERFFRKGEGMAVPSVDRAVQGGTGGGPALFYFEIYPGQDPELNLLIDVRMRRKTEGEVYRDTLYVKMDQPIIRQVRNVDLAQFKPGDYEVTVQALTRLDKIVYARTAEF